MAQRCADLFTPAEELDRRQAILDFIAQFRLQLKEARTAFERSELLRAIRSYEAQLHEPLPANR